MALAPPPAIVDAVTDATAARAVSWRHLVAGHTHAEKWIARLDDGRSVFVKAGLEESAGRQLEREGALLAEIAASFMPDLHGAATLEGWTVLVLEDLSHGTWPPPYPDSGAALLELLDAVAATPPPAWLIRKPEGRPLGTYWERIAAEPEPVLELGAFSREWLERAQPLLHAAESRARLHGDDLVHDDVWAENVCYTERGPVLIDWASPSIGNRQIDLAFALLSIRSSGQTPPPVDFPEEAAFAALLAGADAYQAAQPVPEEILRGSVLRAGWLYDLRYALQWAAARLDLPPPT